MILVFKLKRLYDSDHPVKCNAFVDNIIEIRKYKTLLDVQEEYGEYYFVEKSNVEEFGYGFIYKKENFLVVKNDLTIDPYSKNIEINNLIKSIIRELKLKKILT